MSFASQMNDQLCWNEQILALKFPLHRASKDGDISTVALLLENNSHLAATEDPFFGWTPAHWAAYFGKLDCLKKLLSLSPYAANANIQSSKSFQTPAHCAASGNQLLCLSFLRQAGTDLNAKDSQGETPLHKACRIGSAECVRFLINSCSNIRMTNNAGQNASILAEMNGFLMIAAYVNKAEVLQELGGMFEDPNMQCHVNGFPNFPNGFGAFVTSENVNSTRKRRLEDVDNNSKRMRSDDYILDASPVVNGNFTVLPLPSLSSSVVEHEKLCRMENGYMNAFLECMINQFHGC